MRHQSALPALLVALTASCGGAPDFGELESSRPGMGPGAARAEGGTRGAGYPALWRMEVEHRYGYIDATGEIVIEPRFDYADEFSEGLAVFRTGSGHQVRCGYIDTTGKVVIEGEYNELRDFSRRLAWAHVGGRCHSMSGVMRGGEWRLIDRAGNRVWPK